MAKNDTEKKAEDEETAQSVIDLIDEIIEQQLEEMFEALEI